MTNHLHYHRDMSKPEYYVYEGAVLRVEPNNTAFVWMGDHWKDVTNWDIDYAHECGRISMEKAARMKRDAEASLRQFQPLPH